ncbi:MAG: hypothetical protein GXX96_14725 [Planctomycetaceae bacterium]|nr:hypothetical protein [Planctomycetaceae bacterium]
MNLKITPEIQDALRRHPVGPIQFDGDLLGEPVFVVRLSDVVDLQAKVDERIRKKLAEADADIANGDVALWDAEGVKQRGRARLQAQTNDD